MFKQSFWIVVVIMAILAAGSALYLKHNLGQEGKTWADHAGMIMAVGLTLAIFSFLYHDNPVFKAAEHIYVGVAAGYTVNIYYWNYMLPKLIEPLFYPMFGIGDAGPDWGLLVPMALGLMILMRYVPKLAWMCRYAFAFVMGIGCGMSIPISIHNVFFKHAQATMRPIVLLNDGGFYWPGLFQLLILVGMVSVLVYFFFSVKHTGVIGKVSTMGIYFLMISFGALFGYTVMARMSLLLGRLYFLLDKWLGVIGTT